MPIFNRYQLAPGYAGNQPIRSQYFPAARLRGGSSKNKSLKAGHPNSEDVMRQAFLRSFFTRQESVSNRIRQGIATASLQIRGPLRRARRSGPRPVDRLEWPWAVRLRRRFFADSRPQPPQQQN